METATDGSGRTAAAAGAVAGAAGSDAAEQAGHVGNGETAARQRAMALLAQAKAEELRAAWAAWPSPPAVEAVRPPEVGLVMLCGRIGGGGAPFHVGEATVTRAAVRLAGGELGFAHILGRDRDRARLAAIFDGLWQRPADRAAVEARLLAPVAARLAAAAERLAAETAATRVNFFTLVRGEDG